MSGHSSRASPCASHSPRLMPAGIEAAVLGTLRTVPCGHQSASTSAESSTTITGRAAQSLPRRRPAGRSPRPATMVGRAPSGHRRCVEAVVLRVCGGTGGRAPDSLSSHGRPRRALRAATGRGRRRRSPRTRGSSPTSSTARRPSTSGSAARTAGCRRTRSSGLAPGEVFVHRNVANVVGAHRPQLPLRAAVRGRRAEGQARDRLRPLRLRRRQGGARGHAPRADRQLAAPRAGREPEARRASSPRPRRSSGSTGSASST